MTITLRDTKGIALTHAELDENFTDLDTRLTVEETVTKYTFGLEDYNDTGTSQPLSDGTPIDITNDGAGPYTNVAFKIPGRGAIWNTTLNQFEWNTAGLVLGDTVDIRFDFLLTTGGANREVSVALDLAHGHASEYTLNVGTTLFKDAGTYQVTRFMGLYMGDANTLNNPGKITMTGDGVGDSIVYNGHFVRYALRTPSAT